jgi:hypothetical protein
MTTNRRPTDAVTGLTRTRQSQGDGTMAGRAKIATPHDTSRLRQASGSVIANKPLPQGQCITVHTPSYSIPDGGGKVKFSEIVEDIRHGYTGAAAPLDSLKAPWSGVTQPVAWGEWLDVNHDSAWKGDGAWGQWLLNDIPVGPTFPAQVSGLPVSDIVVPAMYLPVNRNDELALWLQQDSGVAQNVKLWESWGMQDPKQIVATDVGATEGLVVSYYGTSTGSGGAGTRQRNVTVPEDAEVGDMIIALAHVGAVGGLGSPNSSISPFEHNAGWNVLFEDRFANPSNGRANQFGFCFSWRTLTADDVDGAPKTISAGATNYWVTAPGHLAMYVVGRVYPRATQITLEDWDWSYRSTPWNRPFNIGPSTKGLITTEVGFANAGHGSLASLTFANLETVSTFSSNSGGTSRVQQTRPGKAVVLDTGTLHATLPVGAFAWRTQ